jgi:hypothetical protein
MSVVGSEEEKQILNHAKGFLAFVCHFTNVKLSFQNSNVPILCFTDMLITRQAPSSLVHDKKSFNTYWPVSYFELSLIFDYI